MLLSGVGVLAVMGRVAGELRRRAPGTVSSTVTGPARAAGERGSRTSSVRLGRRIWRCGSGAVSLLGWEHRSGGLG